MTLETMSTEPNVSPGEETQNPAPDVADTEESEATVEAVSDEDEAKPEKADADKALNRMQRRIDKRTADYYRAQAENEQLKSRLQQLEAVSDEEPRQRDTDPVALARHIAEVERYAEWANKLVDDGTKGKSDFTAKLKALAEEVGEFVRRDGSPTPFMAVVKEVSDDPKALLYHLGENPDIAEELANLSPTRLAKRLTKIEDEMQAKAKSRVSGAPKPLDPVKANGGGAKTLSSISDEEFAARRRAQIAARR